MRVFGSGNQRQRSQNSLRSSYRRLRSVRRDHRQIAIIEVYALQRRSWRLLTLIRCCRGTPPRYTGQSIRKIMAKHLKISVGFAGVLLGMLFSLCWLVGDDLESHYINVTVFVVSWALGWLLGTLIAPYDVG